MKSEPPNYTAWDFRSFSLPSDSTAARLSFLLRYAVLAPSSHNSQPWRFDIIDNRVLISADPARMLSISDPTGRHAYISIGCCVRNFVLALEAYGLEHKIHFSGKTSAPVVDIEVLDDSRVAGVPNDISVLDAILSRSSNRSPHALSDATLESILSLSGQYSDANLSVHVLSSASELKRAGAITATALAEIMVDKDFRNELSGWVKNNYTSSPLGMPGYVMGVPGVISLALPQIIKLMGPGKGDYLKEQRLIDSETQSVVIWSLANEDAVSWIQAGMQIEDFLVNLSLLGLSASFHTANIESKQAVPELRSMIDSVSRPIAYMRVGVATSTSRSTPRLVVSDCIKE